jgi:hypothetical protein
MFDNKNVFFALFLVSSAILLSGCKVPGFKKKTAMCNEKQCKVIDKNQVDRNNDIWEK